jgi:hypothetical protein
MPLSVFVRRAQQHDVLGMPDAFAVCAKGAVPGIQSTQVIAVVWGKDVADALSPMIRGILANPDSLKKSKAAKKPAPAPAAVAVPENRTT